MFYIYKLALIHIRVCYGGMDVTKYQKKKLTTYSITLPEDVEQELQQIRAETRTDARAWVRDLVIEHLPELKKALKRTG